MDNKLFLESFSLGSHVEETLTHTATYALLQTKEHTEAQAVNSASSSPKLSPAKHMNKSDPWKLQSGTCWTK